jgi:hypothetical protein
MPHTKCVYARIDRRPQAGSVYTRPCIFTVLIFAFLLGIPAASYATSVTATWSPNPEPSIAGYQLMYGTASGSYTTVIDVGKVTSYSFSVTGGVTYYFVLQAYNTMGIYSPYSAEVAFLVPLPTGPSLSSVSPSSGAAGTMVTITGANLGSSPSGSTVSFNGVAATPTSWSATTIVAPVPAGASSGNVVATIAGVPSNGLSFTVASGGGGGGGGGSSPFNGTPAPIPGQIDAANFDNGGEGVSYHDSDPSNAGGQYRQTGVDIEASSEGGFDVGWTGAGEWLNYTVNVASAGTYTVQLRVASPGGASLHLGFNAASNVWKAVPIPATGGWQAWQTVSVPVTLAAGIQQMTVSFDNGGMNIRSANMTSASAGGASGGGGLPSPWLSQDIGIVGQAGSSSYSGAAFTVRGAGADIWGSADAFQFTYQLLTGDGQIVARVQNIQNTNTHAKAGIMFRESPTAGSATVMLDVEPSGSIEFMARGTSGGSMSWLAGANDAAPVWLGLVRTGSTITGYVSPDGSSWTQVGSTTVSFSTTANVGLVVSSHSTSQLNTSTFDQVAVTAAAGSGGGGGGGGSGGSGGLTPFSGTPVSLPGTVPAANFDNGGEGVAYHDTSAGNSGGKYRNTDVDLENSSEGWVDLGWTAPGEWLNYTVNVTSGGNRTVQLRVASPAGGTMHVGFNAASNVWKTVSIPPTGGWQNWTTISLPVTLGPGVQQLTLLFDTGGINVTVLVVN